MFILNEMLHMQMFRSSPLIVLMVRLKSSEQLLVLSDIIIR